MRLLSGHNREYIEVITKMSTRLLSKYYPDSFFGLYPAFIRVLYIRVICFILSDSNQHFVIFSGDGTLRQVLAKTVQLPTR